MSGVFNPEDFLKNSGALPDEHIDLAQCALAFAALDQPGISLERFIHHLGKIAQECGVAHKALRESGAPDDAETILMAMKSVIAGEYEYHGDVDTYDDVQNASLIRVIDRRKGLPVTLAILYIHAGRANGWNVTGLDFPGHFLCRVEHNGQRIIFDPFHECRVMEAPDMRALLKKIKGPGAELSADYFLAAKNRDILFRQQNFIKYRLIELEDYAGALEAVERMRWLDPSEFRLLLDAGVLYARTDQTVAAIRMLEEYIKKTPRERDRHDAALLLRELKGLLN